MGIQFGPVDGIEILLNVSCLWLGKYLQSMLNVINSGDPNLGGLARTRDHTLLNFQCNREVVY
jgi:hypothetical protein